MKIYFIASSDVDSEILSIYRDTVDIIKKQNHTINTSVCFDKTQKINPFSDIYKNITNSIENADIVIADITYPSGGVGFQVYHAIKNKKPIAIIYTNHHKANPSMVIRGIKSSKVFIQEYKNINELQTIIPKLLGSCQKMIKVRFNLVLPNRELSWLNNYSKSKNISTTKLIRLLINNFIKKNEQ